MIAKIAVHGGPRAALAPLPGDWAPEVADAAWLKNNGVTALIRGTSELAEDVNPEARLARSAAKLGIPVYAVEDFPGNWQDSHPLSGLFVEFDWSRKHHLKRGLKAPIHVTGNPRYAGMFPVVSSKVSSEPVVLWLGQPDERVCEGTLELLEPAVKAAGAVLLRRRHPRAAAGPQPRVEQADVVATSFSSVAVEAGFLGIPALFVLLPGLGADYLKRRTGATGLPWVEAGAAFGASTKAELSASLKKALSETERVRARARFEELLEPSKTAAERIASLL